MELSHNLSRIMLLWSLNSFYISGGIDSNRYRGPLMLSHTGKWSLADVAVITSLLNSGSTLNRMIPAFEPTLLTREPVAIIRSNAVIISVPEASTMFVSVSSLIKASYSSCGNLLALLILCRRIKIADELDIRLWFLLRNSSQAFFGSYAAPRIVSIGLGRNLIQALHIKIESLTLSIWRCIYPARRYSEAECTMNAPNLFPTFLRTVWRLALAIVQFLRLLSTCCVASNLMNWIWAAARRKIIGNFSFRLIWRDLGNYTYLPGNRCQWFPSLWTENIAGALWNVAPLRFLAYSRRR